MTTTLLGTKQEEATIDVQTAAGWVQGVDLNNLPPGTVITAIRRTYNVLAGRIYVSVTEFIDRSTGATKQVISRGTVYTTNQDILPNHTVGLLDSPLSYELWDISPELPAPTP